MTSITIQNLDDLVIARLRVRADARHWSIEEEARLILLEAVDNRVGPFNLGEAIHRRFARLNGIELNLPPRESFPQPPQFD